MVNGGMLDYGDLDKDTRVVSVSSSHSGGDYVTSDAGVVYLPFCENCLVNVVSCIEQLSNVFLITFMTKHELGEHTLWKGTNTIDAETMKDCFGKKIDQEEKYCKVTREQLSNGSALSTGMDPTPVLDIFDRIENVEETRVIKLTALRIKHPNFKDDSSNPWRTELLGVKKGGFGGLLQKPGPRTKTKARKCIDKKTNAPNYFVESIVDSKTDKSGKTTYEVKWLGYSPRFNTWQELHDVAHTGHVDVYERRCHLKERGEDSHGMALIEYIDDDDDDDDDDDGGGGGGGGGGDGATDSKPQGIPRQEWVDLTKETFSFCGENNSVGDASLVAEGAMIRIYWQYVQKYYVAKIIRWTALTRHQKEIS